MGDRRATALAGGALLAFAVFLCFFRLDAGGLRNGDEARYAVVADNILQTGDWLTLHYLGEPYFQKSPARFWLSAAGFRAAGVNAWTVRLWSALFGLGGIGMVFLVGRRLRDVWTGLAAGFLLATAAAFLHVHGARTGEMDTAVTFFWLLALWPLLGEELRTRDLVLAAAAASLAGLCKHLAYTPVVLASLLVVLVTRGRRGLPSWRGFAGAVAVALLLLAPWYAVEYLRHGARFWNVIWGRVVLGPAFQAPEPSATRGWGYYFGVWGAGFWPWTLLIPPALMVLAREGQRRWRVWAPWLMLGVLFLFITVSRRKLSWYGLPG